MFEKEKYWQIHFYVRNLKKIDCNTFELCKHIYKNKIFSARVLYLS